MYAVNWGILGGVFVCVCVYMETEILLSAKICLKSNFHRIKRKKGSKTVTQLWVKYFISIVLNTYKIDDDDDILNNVSNNTLYFLS